MKKKFSCEKNLLSSYLGSVRILIETFNILNTMSNNVNLWLERHQPQQCPLLAMALFTHIHTLPWGVGVEC